MEGFVCRGLRIVAQRGRWTQVNFTNWFTSDFTIESTYNAHWLYVGINDRKSQLHERTRKIKGGMLVCLQVWMATKPTGS